MTLTVEELAGYIEATCGVVYQSKQSYYALLNAGGMSYPKTEKVNPKRDESQVQAQRDQIKKTGDAVGRHPTGRRNCAFSG